MATFLFWNVNGKPLLKEVSTLCKQLDVDVLILAELPQKESTEVQLLLELNHGSERVFISPFNPSQRISFFVRFPPESVRLVYDEGGVAIRHLIPPSGIDVLVVAAHLPSKLYYSENDQAFYLTRVAEMIVEAEDQVGHERTLVIGDLNVNPFHDGIVAADGLHAVSDKDIARRRQRTVNGRKKKFFYNPMWGKLGDEMPTPPGTYYYSHSGSVSYFWNTFDQILLRPDLLQCYPENGVQIVHNLDGRSLLHPTRVGLDPTFSDHLPIVLTLGLEGAS